MLVRAGTLVHLSPKGFALLELLLEARPKALAKAEIQGKVWPDTCVSESNLTRIVAEIRAALGDDARQPTLLRTVYGYGYAFAGSAVDESSPERVASPSAASGSSAYTVCVAGVDVTLRHGENLVGRARDCVVLIDSPQVSRHHARILIEGDQVTLADLGSKNGTFLRGLRLEAPAPLRSGDQLRVGAVDIVFRAFSRETDTLEFS
jgi:DNA-binding winged helix-turn-helix (wHTH) protein